MGAQSFKMADDLFLFVSAVQLSLEPSAQHRETVDGDLCLRVDRALMKLWSLAWIMNDALPMVAV